MILWCVSKGKLKISLINSKVKISAIEVEVIFQNPPTLSLQEGGGGGGGVWVSIPNQFHRADLSYACEHIFGMQFPASHRSIFH